MEVFLCFLFCFWYPPYINFYSFIHASKLKDSFNRLLKAVLCSVSWFRKLMNIRVNAAEVVVICVSDFTTWLTARACFSIEKHLLPVC